MSNSEVQLGVRILEDALALLSERGYPQDGYDYVCEDREDHGRDPGQGDAVRTGLEGVLVGTLFGSEFLATASELMTKFREREKDATSGGYIVPLARHVLPVHRHRDYDAQGFILTGVHDFAGARIWPAVTPRHEIALSLSLLGTPTNRIRFLGELTCIYSDAIRLSGQGIGLTALLVRSLSDLVALLRIELREHRDDEGQEA